jgi:type VI secretion system secreted protein Hcp
MAIAEFSSGKAGHGIGDDIFLDITGLKQGKIKGESHDAKHPDQILVIEWGWGATAPRDLATGQASGKRHYDTLKILKRVDASTPMLLNALCVNEQLTDLVLTLRRPGGKDALCYLVIKMKKASVTRISWMPPTESQSWERESVEFNFQSYEMTYNPMKSDTSRRGAVITSDDITHTA